MRYKYASSAAAVRESWPIHAATRTFGVLGWKTWPQKWQIKRPSPFISVCPLQQGQFSSKDFAGNSEVETRATVFGFSSGGNSASTPGHRTARRAPAISGFSSKSRFTSAAGSQTGHFAKRPCPLFKRTFIRHSARGGRMKGRRARQSLPAANSPALAVRLGSARQSPRCLAGRSFGSGQFD